MNKPTLSGKSVVSGIEVPNIVGGFGPDKKSMLVKHVAEMHGRKTLHVNESINNNRNRFIDCVDVIDLKHPENEEIVIGLVDNKFLSRMEVSKADSIFLVSERGYAKLLKIFDDDLAWDKYDEILDGYFRSKEQAIDESLLTTDLQMFKKLFDAVAINQIEAAKTKQEIGELKEAVATIQDTFLERDDDWRNMIKGMINGAAFRTSRDHGEIRSESYKLLESRAHCDLNRRLRGLRKRLEEAGATKTKINMTNRMDVIENDPKLKEIYTTIVKELSIGTLKIAK